MTRGCTEGEARLSAHRKALRIVAPVALAALSLWPAPAQARRFFRARFRPTDLQLVDPGTLEVEADLGLIYGDGQSGTRAPAPDFSIGVGVFDWLELNLDSSYSQTLIGTSQAQYTGEPLWLSGCFDLYSVKDQKTGSTFGIGAQAGPRLPNLHNAQGVGFAGVALIGGGTDNFNVVASIGTALDAGQDPALVYGIDVEYDFGKDQMWSLQGEIAGGVYFGDSSPDQLLLNVGMGAQVTQRLQFLLMLITGPVYQGDRFGFQAGATYDYELWEAEK